MSEEILYQVRIRRHGPVVYARKACEEDISADDLVILKDDKGTDWGEVVSSLFLEEPVSPVHQIVRKASEEDKEKIESLQASIPEVLRIIKDKINYHNLDMNLISAEYTFDKGKLIVYFVSEERVDFRQLVRDLARTFRTRIEMRQIGVRDGAKMLGGLGICGREVCCSLFLREFRSMSIKMAKDQNLSLNPNKISGICGRLMCCLGYEWDLYREALKDMPKLGQVVRLEGEKGKVVEVNVLKQMVKLEVGDDDNKQYVWVNWGGTGTCRCE